MLAVDDPGRQPNFSRFKMMLDTNLSKVAHVLKQCHTVWVIGDLCPPPPSDQLGKILEDFATAVAAYCESKSPPFVIQLDSRRNRPPPKGRYSHQPAPQLTLRNSKVSIGSATVRYLPLRISDNHPVAIQASAEKFVGGTPKVKSETAIIELAKFLHDSVAVVIEIARPLLECEKIA